VSFFTIQASLTGWVSHVTNATSIMHSHITKSVHTSSLDGNVV